MPDDDTASTRGILSESDISYLLDPEGYAEQYSRQSVSERRRRIRERLRAAMVDHLTVLRNFSYKEIQSSLERRANPVSGRNRDSSLASDSQEEIALENGMAAAIGLIYLAGLERNLPKPGLDEPYEYGRFVEGRAEKGIRMALNQLGRTAESVDVTVDIDLGEEFVDLKDLEPADLAEYSETVLLQARLEGELSQKKFMATMREKERLVEDSEVE